VGLKGLNIVTASFIAEVVAGCKTDASSAVEVGGLAGTVVDRRGVRRG